MADAGVSKDLAESVEDARELPDHDRRQDLYFGLVRAIGTDLSEAIAALRTLLETAGYRPEAIHLIKLSSFLVELDRLLGGPGLSGEAEGRFRYYESRMDAGDRARDRFGGEVLALLAVDEANRVRSAPEPRKQGRYGDAFIFDSLMHPEEVALLRSVYGKRFFLLAAHSAAADREESLLGELRASDPVERTYPDEVARARDPDVEKAARAQYAEAEARRAGQVRILVERDEGLSELATPLSPAPRGRRVSIRKTFALADVFISAREPLTGGPNDLPGVLERFVMKVFDEPFVTPTRAELGMAHAYVAARRSGSLARNVGAVITTPDGEILAVGTNEVPIAGGGQYWPLYDGSDIDHRDYRFAAGSGTATAPGEGQDSNDIVKLDLVRDLLARVLQVLPEQVVVDDKQREVFEQHIYDQEGVVSRLLDTELVSTARAFDVIEFSRQVHAEMAAIVSCARRGISTSGAVLYCTTFPCHECSRHIVAAGIGRVVYVEPYPKSRVAELHSDSVTVELFTGHPEATEQLGEDGRVAFEPFLGISPARHEDLFSTTRKKTEAMTTDRNLVGRARFWRFGPSAPLRQTLEAGSATMGTGETMRILASEEYVQSVLVRRGLIGTQPSVQEIGRETLGEYMPSRAPDDGE